MVRLPSLLFLLAAVSALEEECVVGDDGSCTFTSTNQENPTCRDKKSDCQWWANEGECSQNPDYMLSDCRMACGVCGMKDEEIEDMISELLATKQEEERNLEELHRNFGVEQNVVSKKSQQKLEEMMEYMNTQVMVEDRFEESRDICRNKKEECVDWASIGECEANAPYMTTECAPACQTCHLLIFEERCPWIPSNETNIWKQPGDVDKMFRRLVSDDKYSVQVLSQPPEGPWVVTLDDFLSDEECDRLIALGGNEGYEKSTGVGEKQPDGTYASFNSVDRTSTNAWCFGDCYTDEHTKAVLARIEDATGIPDAYQEYLQMLKYTKDQFYGQHHDYIEHLADRAEGVRIVTVFLYLNDVEAGGGTNFPGLDLTVMPKKGRALIWPSVLDEDPNAKDDRTDHQALPVEQGIKFGANSWLHNRDFKEPYGRGC